jgi:hypothetical protein
MISINGQQQTSMELLRIILLEEMCLKPDHVNLYDQKWVIPPLDDMFIVLEYRNGIPIGNNNYFDTSCPDGIPREVQLVNKLEKIVVRVFSRTDEAMYRKDEVSMALMSQYSQFIQESYSFSIARIMPDIDLSELEGTAMLKRYDIEVSVYAWYKKIKKANYIVPPFNIQVTAEDAGSGDIQTPIFPAQALPKL